jgi:flagellar basal body P-ring formation protein FlgA
MIRKIIFTLGLLALAAPATAKDVRIPVLDTMVRMGEVITKGDLAWITIDDSQMYDGIITRDDDVIGQTPRHPLPVRKPVRYMDLERPLAVKKNALITISYHVGSMSLALTGRALDNGGNGDIIQVQNLQSKQVMQAQVTGQNQAEVAAISVN